MRDFNLNYAFPTLMVLAIGCSLFGTEDSSQMKLSLQGNTAVLRKAITVQMIGSGWVKILSGDDFSSPDSPNHTQAFQTPAVGKIQMQFALKDSTDNPLNSGSITLDARSDWRWSVDFVLSEHNPFYGCFGCIGYKAFPVDSAFRTSTVDSFYVIWGGNSIKHPVLY